MCASYFHLPALVVVWQRLCNLLKQKRIRACLYAPQTQIQIHAEGGILRGQIPYGVKYNRHIVLESSRDEKELHKT